MLIELLGGFLFIFPLGFFKLQKFDKEVGAIFDRIEDQILDKMHKSFRDKPIF
jgi:hypothetical protein